MAKMATKTTAEIDAELVDRKIPQQLAATGTAWDVQILCLLGYRDGVLGLPYGASAREAGFGGAR